MSVKGEKLCLDTVTTLQQICVSIKSKIFYISNIFANKNTQLFHLFHYCMIL